MSSQPIDLGSIRAAGLSEVGVKILDIFEDVLNASIRDTESSKPGTGGSVGVEGGRDALRVKSAAKELDGLILPVKPDEQNQPDVEAFLWELWNLLFQIAQLVPFDYDSGHAVLAGIVDELRTIDRGTVTIWAEKQRLWADLPLLGACLREAWIDPTMDADKPDPKSLEKWRNLNHLAQQLWTTGLTSNSTFALWQIRDALEEPIDVPQQSRILIAADWIIRTGDDILRESQPDQHELDDVERRTLKPGSLYRDGKSGFSLDRWRFWQSQFEDVQKESQWAQEVKELARLALESMRSKDSNTC